jgi:hypothetical protein
MRRANALSAKRAVGPVPVTVVANAPLPFPALAWKTDAHLAHKVFPGPGSPYIASHQPVAQVGHASGTGIRWGTPTLMDCS